MAAIRTLQRGIKMIEGGLVWAVRDLRLPQGRFSRATVSQVRSEPLQTSCNGHAPGKMCPIVFDWYYW
jgi:hypothetical protein